MIEVVPYDERWPQIFEGLRDRYRQVLDDHAVRWLEIEHVGSTSVPGLAAKAVIDIDIVVPTASEAVRAGDALGGIGFRPLGDLGIPGRWAFREPDDLPRTNTYVVLHDSLALRNHLAVRRVLREDAAMRERYAGAKARLARTAGSGEEYVAGKSGVLQAILVSAGLDEADRAAIAAVNDVAQR